MSTKVTGIPTVKKHWYKSAWFPWMIIVIVVWTVIVFIASYFYTTSVNQQRSAQVVREVSSIVQTLKSQK